MKYYNFFPQVPTVLYTLLWLDEIGVTFSYRQKFIWCKNVNVFVFYNQKSCVHAKHNLITYLAMYEMFYHPFLFLFPFPLVFVEPGGLPLFGVLVTTLSFNQTFLAALKLGVCHFRKQSRSMKHRGVLHFLHFLVVKWVACLVILQYTHWDLRVNITG